MTVMVKRSRDEQVRFWEVSWTLPNSGDYFPRSLFFHWEEMLNQFEELRFDRKLNYSVYVQEHIAPLEPEALVKFLDDFVHNLIPTKDITDEIEYLARVVEPMRKLVSTLNALVTWEKDRITFRADSESTDTEDLRTLLVVDRPTLLLGTILEIVRREEGSYDVIFEINPVHSENYDLNTDYLVSLRADDSLVKSLFECPRTHKRPEHETPTIALFADIKRIDPCDEDDQDLLGYSFILSGELVEFFYSDLIFERSYVDQELISLLSHELDPRDFRLHF